MGGEGRPLRTVSEPQNGPYRCQSAASKRPSSKTDSMAECHCTLVQSLQVVPSGQNERPAADVQHRELRCESSEAGGESVTGGPIWMSFVMKCLPWFALLLSFPVFMLYGLLDVIDMWTDGDETTGDEDEDLL